MRYPRYRSFDFDHILEMVAQKQRAAKQQEDESEQARRNLGVMEKRECTCVLPEQSCPACMPKSDPDQELPY